MELFPYTFIAWWLSIKKASLLSKSDTCPIHVSDHPTSIRENVWIIKLITVQFRLTLMTPDMAQEHNTSTGPHKEAIIALQHLICSCRQFLSVTDILHLDTLNKGQSQPLCKLSLQKCWLQLRSISSPPPQTKFHLWHKCNVLNVAEIPCCITATIQEPEFWLQSISKYSRLSSKARISVSAWSVGQNRIVLSSDGENKVTWTRTLSEHPPPPANCLNYTRFRTLNIYTVLV
jgi:hypothetical protein